MSAIQPLSHLIDQSSKILSKEERLLLEAELFICTCKELKEIFREKYRNYFYIMKFTMEMENIMLESSFLRLIIQDILSTEEYNLEGIAYYADIHEDVLREIVIGCNANPSAIILQRIIELHRSIRRELYRSIVKKVTEENLLAA